MPKGEPTNKQRAGRIERVLRTYIRAGGGDPDDASVYNIADLLADVRHYCESEGIDFDRADNLGACHYAEEGGALPDTAGDAVAFVELVARMTLTGEPVGQNGEPYVADVSDGQDTLEELIASARQILAK